MTSSPSSDRAPDPATKREHGLDVRASTRTSNLGAAGPIPLGRADRLVRAIQELSLRRDLESVMAIVRTAARELTSADGATFVLREGDQCFYADEDAISPLWKGKRFPLSACLSGWVMEHREAVVLEDIYADPRVPADAYRPTFVKSLAMVPIRAQNPVGVIGNYWASHHRATEEDVRLLQALADSTSIALENVKLYTQLEQRAREAEQAVQIRDEFLSAAAHELRTPLTTLQLQLDLLARDPARVGADSGVSRIDRARASSRRLSDLIDMMLTATYSAAGELVLVRTRCDLVEILREVFQRCSTEAERNGCSLELDAPDSVVGTWDAARLGQVASCLVSNAVKYSAGQPVRVRIAGGTHACMTVSNHGNMIGETEFATLFERFTRATPARMHAGLGLGLYVAKLIMLAHGGNLSVDSGPEIGTTFTACLPYVQNPAKAVASG